EAGAVRRSRPLDGGAAGGGGPAAPAVRRPRAGAAGLRAGPDGLRDRAAHRRRRAVRGPGHALGEHGLHPGRDGDDAGLRQAQRPGGPQAAAGGGPAGLPRRIGARRTVHGHDHVDRRPHHPGVGRRRLDHLDPGRRRRRRPRPRARGLPKRDRGRLRALGGGRPGRRRLADRGGRLALGLLAQPPAWRAGGAGGDVAAARAAADGGPGAAGRLGFHGAGGGRHRADPARLLGWHPGGLVLTGLVGVGGGGAGGGRGLRGRRAAGRGADHPAQPLHRPDVPGRRGGWPGDGGRDVRHAGIPAHLPADGHRPGTDGGRDGHAHPGHRPGPEHGRLRLAGAPDRSVPDPAAAGLAAGRGRAGPAVDADPADPPGSGGHLPARTGPGDRLRLGGARGGRAEHRTGQRGGRGHRHQQLLPRDRCRAGLGPGRSAVHRPAGHPAGRTGACGRRTGGDDRRAHAGPGAGAAASRAGRGGRRLQRRPDAGLRPAGAGGAAQRRGPAHRAGSPAGHLRPRPRWGSAAGV
ncbi:MAG: Uncharacterized MFS-type transporter, partial [uncultured Friedmanniella sp.]